MTSMWIETSEGDPSGQQGPSLQLSGVPCPSLSLCRPGGPAQQAGLGEFFLTFSTFPKGKCWSLGGCGK